MLDAYRLYNNCTFNNPVNFATHNSFNSAVFRGCIFNNDVIIANKNATKAIGEIAFINCKFNGTVTADNKNNSQIQFINCEFSNSITYGNTYAESLCEFTDKELTVETYVEIIASKTTLAVNKTLTIQALVIPLYIEDRSVTWSIEGDLATIDQNGVITAGATTGEFVVKCTTKNGLVAEKTLTIS